MAQQIPLTFSEVLNLPSLGVSANAIKFGVRDPSHRYRNISHLSGSWARRAAAAARAAPVVVPFARKRARARETPFQPRARTVSRRDEVKPPLRVRLRRCARGAADERNRPRAAAERPRLVSSHSPAPWSPTPS